MLPRYSSTAVSALAVSAICGASFMLVGAETTTRTLHETALPALFLNVNLYVVVLAGFTLFEPESALEPIAGDMITLVAFLLDQVSVTACPGRIAVLLDEREQVGAATTGFVTRIVTFFSASGPGFGPS